VTTWDGVGVPRSAEARLERARASGARTSLLPIAGQISLGSTGFQVVGDVMGCIVLQVEPKGKGNCGFFGGVGKRHTTPDVITSGSNRAPGGFAAYVAARYFGWDSAIARMRAEAVGLGADGVIDVRLSERPFDGHRSEFMAIGTAVLASGRTHMETPFTTTFGGADLAKLVSVGWMTASIVVGMSVAIRHDDFRMRLGRRALARNREIEGLSALANAVRQDARHQLDDRTAHGGADGVILSSQVPATLQSVRAGPNHYDHIAETVVFGSTVVRIEDFRRRPESTLRVMPLTAGSHQDVRANGSEM
jgi:uncharacterized protein YbjQ (UPF0145 family)